MSTDWNVHCLDCKSTHHFDDANHQVDLMLALCKHADAIAGLQGLMANVGVCTIELRTMWGLVDVGWFHTHKGHTLRPISEYGDLLGECRERIVCACCKASSQSCTLPDGHEGEHRRTR
jgi:hypothetical protein